MPQETSKLLGLKARTSDLLKVFLAKVRQQASVDGCRAKHGSEIAQPYGDEPHADLVNGKLLGVLGRRHGFRMTLCKLDGEYETS